MFDLFTEEATETVSFPSGASVVMKRHIDAGVHEDIEAEIQRMRYNHRERDENGLPQQEFLMHASRLRMLASMIIEIRTKDGQSETGPFSVDYCRQFSREALVMLTDVIDEHNVPLSTVRQRVMATRMGVEMPGLTTNPTGETENSSETTPSVMQEYVQAVT